MSGSDRVLDKIVLGFGYWTLCAHAAVFAGTGLDALMIGFAASVAIISAAAIALRVRGAGEAPAPEGGADETDEPPSLGMRAGVAAGAVACAAAGALGAPLLGTWAVAVALVGFAALREIFASSPSRMPAREVASVRPSHIALLIALAVICVTVTLASHRPDADDGFYLNLAVAAVDDPAAPLLARDTLHGERGVPLPLPVYRVHSLELLQGAVARLSGRPVLDVAHLVFPFFAALMVPLAWARLSRRLLPDAWIWATAIAVGVLLFFATASHGWSNFGLVRLHQGKALLLTLALPLTLVYAIEFARGGRPAAWLRLAAVQIGAMGASASALWLGPAVAAIGLLAGVSNLREPKNRTRSAVGLAASAYVIAAALMLRAATAAAFQNAPVPSPELELTNLELTRQALRAVIGPGLPGTFAFFAAIGAWAFAPTTTARRVCAFSAFATLLLWNPLIATTVATNLTSAPTYWRVLWLLPMPMLVAVVLTAPIQSGRSPAIAGGLAVVLFGASILQSPGALAPSAANGTRLGSPSWKVPLPELDAALAIAAASGPRERVLAPRLVAPWIPALHDHASPLVVRTEYLPVLHAKLGDDELRRRVQLMRLVSGRNRPARAAELLRDALASDRLAVVCIARATTRWPDVVAILPAAGFQKIHANADYEVWESPNR